MPALLSACHRSPRQWAERDSLQEPWGGRALRDTAPVGELVAGWARRCFAAGLNPGDGATLGSAASLCPVRRRRAGVPSRFLRCLHPTSSGQVGSLKPSKPSSSRARKAFNRSSGLGNYRRAVPPCAEKTQQRVCTCPGGGAEGLTGTLRCPQYLSRILDVQRAPFLWRL